MALKGAKGVVLTNNSCRILRNVAFALGFVGVYDYSNLVVFIPPPPPHEKKEGNISYLFAMSCKSKSEYIICLVL